MYYKIIFKVKCVPLHITIQISILFQNSFWFCSLNIYTQTMKFYKPTAYFSPLFYLFWLRFLLNKLGLRDLQNSGFINEFAGRCLQDKFSNFQTNHEDYWLSRPHLPSIYLLPIFPIIHLCCGLGIIHLQRFIWCSLRSQCGTKKASSYVVIVVINRLMPHCITELVIL